VAVLVATGPDGVLAAKQASTTIPIVFSVGSDPVEIGLVVSLNRPGGNITGVCQFTAGLEAKRLDLLQEMVPKATTIAVLVNPNYPGAENQLRDAQEAATRLGVQLVGVRASTEEQFNAAFLDDGSTKGRSAACLRIPILQFQVPAACTARDTPCVTRMYEWREFAAAGGLMSYGTSLADAYQFSALLCR
jgi:putative ABC transport system substrate-binding protein